MGIQAIDDLDEDVSLDGEDMLLVQEDDSVGVNKKVKIKNLYAGRDPLRVIPNTAHPEPTTPGFAGRFLFAVVVGVPEVRFDDGSAWINAHTGV